MFLVTGGAGFIGSNLVAALEAKGAEVAVCDRLGHDDKWRNLGKRELADLFPPERLGDWLKGRKLDGIYHMGAISTTTETDADLILSQNFSASLDLWNWCTDAKVPLVYASSAATYGDGAAGFDDNQSPEALAKLQPLNAYGWSKHLFDRRAVRLAAAGHKPPRWAGLKFFNVYGPNEYHKGSQRSVVHQAWGDASAGKPVVLVRAHRAGIDHGAQSRDFIYVDDAVDVVLWFLDDPKVSGLFNLGTGKARSFKDLANAVFVALGKKPNIEFVDTPENIRAKYQYFTEAPMRRLREAGYTRPFTSIEDGTRKYVQDFLAKDQPYR